MKGKAIFMTKALSPKKLTWLLTLVYFASYLTRINFAAIIQAIVADTGYSKSALSFIPVCLFITYAIGQVVNGRLGDKLNPQNLLFCGIFASSLINLVFPLCAGSIVLMSVLWGLNGFVQAMVWPPMIRILVSTMTDEEYNQNAANLTVGSTGGKITIFLLAPLLLSFMSWRGVFYVCAAIGIAVSMLFFFSRKSIVMKEIPTVNNEEEKKGGFHLPRASVLPTVLIFIAIIFHGALREGLDTWVPSYLVEVFRFDNQTAIFSRVFLSVFALVSILITRSIYRRFFENEVLCCALLFGVSGLATLLLFIFYGIGAIPTILAMMLVSGIQGGLNLLLIVYVPKRFCKYGNISTISGVLDAFAYLGAAASTWGVARVAENAGWRATIGVWLAFSAIGILCCLLAARPWKRFYRQ